MFLKSGNSLDNFMILWLEIWKYSWHSLETGEKKSGCLRETFINSSRQFVFKTILPRYGTTIIVGWLRARVTYIPDWMCSTLKGLLLLTAKLAVKKGF